jgi:hypothetical protein
MNLGIRTLLASAFVVGLTLITFAADLPPGQSRELRMSLNDTFVITGREGWKIDVNRVLPLRLAEVYLLPKQGTDLSVALRFLCDTPDLAKFDTPEKMLSAVEADAQRKIPRSVEKTLEITRLDSAGRYGFYTTLTDAALADSPSIDPGHFRYLTQGMLRLSDDSALSFIIYTNDLNAKAYADSLDYIQSFAKPPANAATRP